MTKLVKKIILSGRISLVTGLHIGGTNSAMGIGGPDATVIRNPMNNEPYIPGSSIKGKMRSLIEVQDGTIDGVNMGVVKHGPSLSLSTVAARLFGTADLKTNNQQASRLIVRDCKLLTPEESFLNTDLPYTESKTEVVIDRITSAAMPRQVERVPATAEFELNLVLNIFDTDNEQELIETTNRAIKLLEDDYLGGNGSRGYGQIKIHIDKTEHRTEEHYKNAAKKTI
ncbi:MAG: type III-A CRISPR-associated RAMP protein Csm3 [Lentimicrobiaceae bacterium]|jgi:CRISPR-associated protein Csm3|nr:type III-A CRISPR-associated RAMP protein Csm3 [Lentimicrobiaceae bacterium]MDD4597407.1 type III-A CRISPR-associated RAMP protein Csm3 [Lentimicrobiaceae bacterium]MDY0025930.1 type III-A CRISPR-associated RAMP protein Csm3 [Lentimicrobium sp.]HAH59871.1 type III-A CRISPR-associated RAMP protein Csm3 [Bacteroidales bacterium]